MKNNPFNELTDPVFLRYVAQNDYMIDGYYLPEGARLNAAADAIERTETLLREQTQKAIEAAFALREAKRERDEAQAKYERIFKGLEGSCMSCEPVGVLNQKMEQQIKTLIAERDEARREVCAWQSGNTGDTFQNTATIRGWDCFKENTNG
ncbi:MAG: hypothetical protein EBU08_23905 [Micrococcales bacterium]|nr:hypothetical protein [Micrococcales bacterium]